MTASQVHSFRVARMKILLDEGEKSRFEEVLDRTPEEA
jgi:hypothetical protein